jgi:hypothetical protein
VEIDSDNEQTSVHQQQNVGDVDELKISEEPIAKAFGISKRLRSSKSKVVSVVNETPKAKKGTKMYGPKKGWSKATPRNSVVQSKKRKCVSSSDSKYNVEKDVPNIVESRSVSKKSTVKKGPPNVKEVATDKISFHYPEYAHMWKFVFNRRLAFEGN